jgi:hypothetical protein
MAALHGTHHAWLTQPVVASQMSVLQLQLSLKAIMDHDDLPLDTCLLAYAAVTRLGLPISASAVGV